MIVNIRGTSGSGKSTLVRQLLTHINATPMGVSPTPGYVGRLFGTTESVAVVGSYHNQCGGCDGIKTQDEIESRVLDFAATYDHVVFEGVLISTIYSRWAHLAHQRPPWSFLFLDTPLDVCIARINERRAAKGNNKPVDPTNTEAKFRAINRAKERFLADDLPVFTAPYLEALPALLKLFS